jgi:monoamine oxidase
MADYDVLVLGAGAAGLAAAMMLDEAGSSVCIVEAQHRLGGRIWTHHEEGSTVPIELGAEFMHGRSPDLLELVRKFQQPYYGVDGDYWCCFEDELKACDFWGKVESILKRMKSDAKDMSFLEFLSEQPADPTARRRALAYIEGFEAADPTRISVNALVREHAAMEKIDGDSAFRLTAGFDGLIRGLAQNLNCPIEMNMPVRSVKWKKGVVEFHSDRKSFSGSRAIITLPLGVWQAGSVVFSPAIQTKARALSLLAAGPVIRIAIRFHERFWEGIWVNGKSLGNLSFLFSDHKLFPTWWSSMPVKSTVLVGWSAGPHAGSFISRDKEFVFEQATESLARKLHMNAKELRELVASYHFHDWQTDPFSCGAYSYALVGGSDAFDQLAQPIEKTLFFAGEATNGDGHNGTVHGAIATGYRAAKEVLRSMRNEGSRRAA